MKKLIFVGLGLMLIWGCARVRVEAPKEPIKVDVSMRLDIYQHIEKDITQIEDMVSGAPEKSQPKGNQSFLEFFSGNAYAAEGLDPEVEGAALRRKERRPELISFEEKGIIGENKSGLVEIRISEKATPDVEVLIQAENADRMVIYRSVAEKNGTSVAEVQRLYAKRLQSDAPSGTPIEVVDEATGNGEWKIK